MPSISDPARLALKLAALGWHIMPLSAASKRPLGNCPACRDRRGASNHLADDCACLTAGGWCHGVRAATTDPARITAWWQHEPAAVPAVAAGPSGLVLIDVDNHGGSLPADLATGLLPGIDLAAEPRTGQVSHPDRDHARHLIQSGTSWRGHPLPLGNGHPGVGTAAAPLRRMLTQSVADGGATAMAVLMMMGVARCSCRASPNFGTYSAQPAVACRWLPVPAGQLGVVSVMPSLPIGGRICRWEAGFRGWAGGRLPCTESHAGVAQQAEQPSCKRQVSGSNPLTGSRRSSRFSGDHFHVWV